MLKQLSVPKKIFGAITLLSAICYVGTMVYVHRAFADTEHEHWVRYHAMVHNITKSNDTFTVTTIHKLRYHNHHNHTVSDGKALRAGSQWRDVTPKTGLHPLLTNEVDAPITMISGYGTFTVTRTRSWDSTPGRSYHAGAYTNLKTGQGWDNDAVVFDQIEKFTADFAADDFGPGTPPLPTADPSQMSNHAQN